VFGFLPLLPLRLRSYFFFYVKRILYVSLMFHFHFFCQPVLFQHFLCAPTSVGARGPCQFLKLSGVTLSLVNYSLDLFSKRLFFWAAPSMFAVLLLMNPFFSPARRGQPRNGPRPLGSLKPRQLPARDFHLTDKTGCFVCQFHPFPLFTSHCLKNGYCKITRELLFSLLLVYPCPYSAIFL